MKRKNEAVSALSVPEEVKKPCAVLTAVGDREITVEGHGGILAYERETVRLRAGGQVLSVLGSRLVIDYYNDEEMKIIGRIAQICWEDAGGGKKA